MRCGGTIEWVPEFVSPSPETKVAARDAVIIFVRHFRLSVFVFVFVCACAYCGLWPVACVGQLVVF